MYQDFEMQMKRGSVLKVEIIFCSSSNLLKRLFALKERNTRFLVVTVALFNLLETLHLSGCRYVVLGRLLFSAMATENYHLIRRPSRLSSESRLVSTCVVRFVSDTSRLIVGTIFVQCGTNTALVSRSEFPRASVRRSWPEGTIYIPGMLCSAR